MRLAPAGSRRSAIVSRLASVGIEPPDLLAPARSRRAAVGAPRRSRPVEPLRRATVCRGRDPPGGGAIRPASACSPSSPAVTLAGPRPVRSGGSSPGRRSDLCGPAASSGAGCLRRSVLLTVRRSPSGRRRALDVRERRSGQPGWPARRRGQRRRRGRPGCRRGCRGPSWWRWSASAGTGPWRRVGLARLIASTRLARFSTSWSSSKLALPTGTWMIAPLSTLNSTRPALDLADRALEVERDRARLGVRHQAAAAQDAAEAADHAHHVRAPRGRRRTRASRPRSS